MRTIIQKSLCEFLICKNEFYNAKMQEFFANPDFYLDHTTYTSFKNTPGDTTTVAIVTIDNKKLVVKRYNVKSLWHSLKKLFRQSRAMRSWINSHYLLQHNILTPKPVAVLIQRLGPWRKKTYFIAEYVPSSSGADFFAATTKTAQEWQDVIQNINTLIDQLQHALITHADFQHRNLVMVANQPYLLDLDHMRIHHYKSWWFHHNSRKDLQHFIQLLEVNPEVQKLFNRACLLKIGAPK